MNTAAILAELQRPLSPADGTRRSRRMLAFPLTVGDGFIREWTLAQWRSEDVGVLPAQRFRAKPALPRQQYTIDEARGQEEELALSGLLKSPGRKKQSHSIRMEAIQPTSFRSDSLWTILHCSRSRGKHTCRLLIRPIPCMPPAVNWPMAEPREESGMTWLRSSSC